MSLARVSFPVRTRLCGALVRAAVLGYATTAAASAAATPAPAPAAVVPDADLYVSLDSSTPTRCTFTACNTTTEPVKAVRLVLPSRSDSTTGGTVNVYVGVVGYSSGVTPFTVTVTQAEVPDESSGGDVVGSGDAVGVKAGEVPEGSQRCKFCGTAVPLATLPLHESRCVCVRGLL